MSVIKKMINNLRYADNTVVIAETETELQQLIDTVVQESEIKSLYFNCAKYVTMVVAKSTITACNITVQGKCGNQLHRLSSLEDASKMYDVELALQNQQSHQWRKS